MKTQTRMARLVTGMLAVAALAALTNCATHKEEKAQRVSLSEMSASARATVEKVTAGGQVARIDKEVERGKLVYDVEATVGGKHVEYLIDDADGSVLGTETSIEFNQLPEPVRAAAEKFFGSSSGLKAMKGEEFGETSYEIEGSKKGKVVEVTFDPNGKRTE